MAEDKKESVSSAVIGELFRKAVETGAKVYVGAETAAAAAKSQVQIPKELLKDVIETFFKHYSISVTADIEIKPRKDKKAGENT